MSQTMKTSKTEHAEAQASDLLTFEEAASWLGLGRQGYRMPGEAVRNLCRTRRLRHVKIGKRVFVRRKWLEEYLERVSVPAIEEQTKVNT